ncbi:FkbM family methyltransferase [Pelagibacterales bacterium SAG-MED28]|nr:FkbM family methyltransferase [Pelagibacterales bacterium SAG-MED28]|tara:strand:+ start:159 stop:1007 length:849 start_codon:yes stop_codon:yes gene_type:complete
MISSLKKFFDKILSLSGYKLIGRKDIVKHNSFNAIHKFIFEKMVNKSKLIIFDVGANDGRSIIRFESRFPDAEIYSFEPTKSAYGKISKLSSEKIRIFNYALSNIDGEKEFCQYEYLSGKTNSFYPMVKNSKYRLQRTVSNNETETIKCVKVKKLDTFLEENEISNIDLLKIDTQGAEIEILKGAEKTLNSKKINVIELEYILGIAHEVESSLFEIENLLHKNDYKLIAIEHADNVISFSNYQTNLIYVKNEIFNKIKQFHENNIDVKNITNKVNNYQFLNL